MRTFIYRYEIGTLRRVLRLQAKSTKVATAYAKLFVHNEAAGQAYMLWGLL